MKGKEQLIDSCKQAAYEVRVLSKAVDHSRPYAQQLRVLAAVDQANRNFEHAAAELEAYAYCNLPRIKAARVRYQLMRWRKLNKEELPS